MTYDQATRDAAVKYAAKDYDKHLPIFGPAVTGAFVVGRTEGFYEGADYGRRSERERILAMLMSEECYEANEPCFTSARHIADWLETRLSEGEK